MSEKSSSQSDFLIYRSPGGDVKVEVVYQEDSVWLTQRQMAELFDVTVPTISEHLANVYDAGELSREATIRKIRTVQIEGGRDVSRELDFYNLDAIISVGYRVNSARATQFRIWATQVLREFIIKGFVLDDERLKHGEKLHGRDYFNELLERIRSIRASERRIYLQITDIFAECSTDYDPHSSVTKDFFAMVQNKFHFAITGQTAAESIHSQADQTKPYMGLNNGRTVQAVGCFRVM